MSIPIIDLFAGPGGLGEGFASVQTLSGQRYFDIALSIEKDEDAHRTLLLRSFFRQFRPRNAPKEYYMLLRKEIKFEDLFMAWPVEAERAKNSTLRIQLGQKSEEFIDRKISDVIGDFNKKWLLIGGPPCQAYSVIGRSRMGGIDKDDPRLYLYKQFYRLLARFSPPIFIMENVSGILSAKSEGLHLFEQLMKSLSDPTKTLKESEGIKYPSNISSKYRIFSTVKNPTSYLTDGTPNYLDKEFVVKSELYGIPQTRHRIILMGVREDINIEPLILKKVNTIKAGQVLKGLPRLRSGLSKKEDSWINWLSEIKKINSNGVLEDADPQLRQNVRIQISRIRKPRYDRGNDFIEHKSSINYLQEWYLDPNYNGVSNHTSRGHISEDLWRYLFATIYAKFFNRSPNLSNFPHALLPLHKNVHESMVNTKFSDRFRVVLSNFPSKTITSHIAKDGHYYIHPDPTQCRSLTVREAARLQTFPDNFLFCGARTSQYKQVGNAVPPLLASKIARLAMNLLDKMG